MLSLKKTVFGSAVSPTPSGPAIRYRKRRKKVVIPVNSPFVARRGIIGRNLQQGITRTNHLIVRAAQAARGRGIRFTKAVKSLLSLCDPDDKVVRAILSFGYSHTFIDIK